LTISKTLTSPPAFYQNRENNPRPELWLRGFRPLSGQARSLGHRRTPAPAFSEAEFLFHYQELRTDVFSCIPNLALLCLLQKAQFSRLKEPELLDGTTLQIFLLQ
jgi:hypothetical protein